MYLCYLWPVTRITNGDVGYVAFKKVGPWDGNIIFFFQGERIMGQNNLPSCNHPY